MKKFLEAILNLVVLGAVIWGGYVMLAGVGAYFRSLDSDVAKAIVAAAAALIGSVVTITLGKAYETRLATLKELRAKKVPIYEEIISGVFRILFASMLNMNPPTDDEVKLFFARTTEMLTIWGSNDMVKAFGRFKSQVSDPSNPNQVMFVVEDLMFAIRKDLGHAAKLERGAVLRLFITDIEDVLKKSGSK